MNSLQYMFAAVEAVLLFVVGYLYLLALASVWPQKRTRSVLSPRTKFAVIVPAHNEVDLIHRTVSSIENQEYPHRLFDTFVIADNCTDETVAVVRQSNATCLERWDSERRGKGWVLRWAFQRLDERNVQPDAFVIVDADSVLAPEFLRIMDNKIQGGAKVLQGYYDVLHPESSITGSLSYFGFALSRYLRYMGRTRLGWSSNLLGNGMCFRRDIIQQFGWPATSIVEDLEYGIMLLLQDVRVRFVPEAKVFAEIPGSFRLSRTQRVRWDLGRFAVRNMYLVKLLKAAIRRRDGAFLDAALELVIPPFSLFMAITAGFFIFFLGVSFRGTDALFSLWLVIVGSLFIYILIGLVMAKGSVRMYKNLIYAPYFLLWRVFIAVTGAATQENKDWRKTKRGNVRESAH